jgi:hypothetical protein
MIVQEFIHHRLPASRIAVEISNDPGIPRQGDRPIAGIDQRERQRVPEFEMAIRTTSLQVKSSQ